MDSLKEQVKDRDSVIASLQQTLQVITAICGVPIYACQARSKKQEKLCEGRWVWTCAEPVLGLPQEDAEMKECQELNYVLFARWRREGSRGIVRLRFGLKQTEY